MQILLFSKFLQLMSFIQVELASQIACEQALWSGKERRKQRVRTNKEMERGWGGKEGGGEARDRAC